MQNRPTAAYNSHIPAATPAPTETIIPIAPAFRFIAPLLTVVLEPLAALVLEAPEVAALVMEIPEVAALVPETPEVAALVPETPEVAALIPVAPEVLAAAGPPVISPRIEAPSEAKGPVKVAVRDETNDPMREVSERSAVGIAGIEIPEGIVTVKLKRKRRIQTGIKYCRRYTLLTHQSL
ncbi:hypothetical protein BT96DRAFT_400067 [Gymnopus androsaceus JB14]|uniref:Uncharacterized protein n=1 Tax=Gymnopus androsaceus JB14 TaxID=1447944 RepID=A0A6A4GUP8_9AGAR|nr:hypothetical protein BT96DRAFT_400067 [Gymnopus androsaceus JB14]